MGLCDSMDETVVVLMAGWDCGSIDGRMGLCDSMDETGSIDGRMGLCDSMNGRMGL